MEQSPVEFLQSFMEQNRYFIGNDLLIAFIKAQQIHEHRIRIEIPKTNMLGIDCFNNLHQQFYP